VSEFSIARLPKNAPAIVLLHGFPSSSREFDTLIPLLATRYHLIAPDFPGFGQSDAPPPSSYAYTFDNLARTIDRLLEQLKINRYTLPLACVGTEALCNSPLIRQGLLARRRGGIAGGILRRRPCVLAKGCLLGRPDTVSLRKPNFL
jgi:alpha/beta hydrolase fold